MASAVEIKGLDALIRKMQSLGQVVKIEVDYEAREGAREMSNVASKNIRDNPHPDGLKVGLTDEGLLLQSQQMIEAGNRTYQVVNTAPYAAYQEFGTGKRFRAHPDWLEIAAEFRGKKGASFAEFIKRIEGWCVRHGIPSEYAYVICINILNNGLRPRPFLQPAFYEVGPKIVKRIEQVIADAVR